MTGQRRPRGRCTFRQQDLTRALKGAKAAGVEVATIEIDREGKIVMVTNPSGAAEQGGERNPWHG